MSDLLIANPSERPLRLHQFVVCQLALWTAEFDERAGKRVEIPLLFDLDALPDFKLKGRDSNSHGFTNPFETACWLLDGYGITIGAHDLYGPFLVDLRDIPGIVRDLSPERLAEFSFDKCLSTYLQYACFNRGLPSTARLFDIPDEFRGDILFLMEAGYLLESSGRFKWSNKAAPMLRNSFIWNENNQCFHEARREEEARSLQDEIDRLWRSMPPGFVNAIFELKTVEARKEKLNDALIWCWDGETWRHPDELRTELLDENRNIGRHFLRAAELCERIFELGLLN